jgi:hypothetical protein
MSRPDQGPRDQTVHTAAGLGATTPGCGAAAGKPSSRGRDETQLAQLAGLFAQLRSPCRDTDITEARTSGWAETFRRMLDGGKPILLRFGLQPPARASDMKPHLDSSAYCYCPHRGFGTA